jgi:sugar phosphate permease
MSNERSGWNDALAKAYRQRWRIWFVAVLSHSIGLFHRAALGPMADRLMADFDLTAAAFGSLGAIYFYVYAAMQLPSGTLADTFGPRKTITLSLLISAAGSVVMGLAPSFSILYFGRLLVSFGASFAWLSALKIIMNWFRSREVATVTGLAGAINNSGQLLAATPLAVLIIAIGWRMSFVTAAAVSIAVAALNWFIVKDTPQDAGLPSIAEIEGEEVRLDESGPTPPSILQRLGQIVRTKQIWPLFLVCMGIYGAYGTFFLNWLVVYLMQTYGLTRDHASSFALVSAVGAILGTSALGFVSDYFHSRRKPIIMATTVSLACYIAIAFWNGGKPPLAAFWPIGFLAGFNVGGMPITYAAVRDTVSAEVRGMGTGLVNMGAFIGAAAVQPLFGYVLDLGWQGEMLGDIRLYPVDAFQRAMLLPLLLIALGFLGSLFVRDRRRYATIEPR